MTKCSEIEADNNTRLIHARIKELASKAFKIKTGGIQTESGKLVTEKEDIMERWSEYIEQLFYDVRSETPIKAE